MEFCCIWLLAACFTFRPQGGGMVSVDPQSYGFTPGSSQ